MNSTFERSYGTVLDRPRMSLAKRLLEARDHINSVYWGTGSGEELLIAKEILETLVEKIVQSAWAAQERQARAIDAAGEIMYNDDETKYPDENEYGG